jgi:hypothetical protein
VCHKVCERQFNINHMQAHKASSKHLNTTHLMSTGPTYTKGIHNEGAAHVVYSSHTVAQQQHHNKYCAKSPPLTAQTASGRQ